MPRLTELCIKSNCAHKGFVILLPYRTAVQITVEYNALHVICQHISGDTHILKSVDHPNKQVFLFGIRKEFNITLSAMVADHGKAGHAVDVSVVIQHIGKAPVHLVGLTGI